MFSHFPHMRKLTLFLTLSAADLGLTWHLLANSGGAIHEANPLADWLLSHGGWAGLAAFKALTVLVVVGAALGVEQHSNRSAGWARQRGGYVLALACAVLTLVVGWSTALSVSVATRSDGLLDSELVGLMRDEDGIDLRIDRAAMYREDLLRLTQELGDDKVRLSDVVDHLVSTERGSDPEWHAAILHMFPLPTFHQAMAAHVGHHTLNDLRHRAPERVAEVADRLSLAFHEAYPSPAVERTGLALFEPFPNTQPPCQ